MRPILTKNVSIDEFQPHYWLKKELVAFCKEHQLSTSGSKEELTNRIVHYLQTGENLKPIKKTKTVSASIKNVPLSLETVINSHHRCSQDVRAFFKSVIGSHFHFSTHIQIFLKKT